MRLLWATNSRNSRATAQKLNQTRIYQNNLFKQSQSITAQYRLITWPLKSCVSIGGPKDLQVMVWPLMCGALESIYTTSEWVNFRLPNMRDCPSTFTTSCSTITMASRSTKISGMTGWQRSSGVSCNDLLQIAPRSRTLPEIPSSSKAGRDLEQGQTQKEQSSWKIWKTWKTWDAAMGVLTQICMLVSRGACMHASSMHTCLHVRAHLHLTCMHKGQPAHTLERPKGHLWVISSDLLIPKGTRGTRKGRKLRNWKEISQPNAKFYRRAGLPFLGVQGRVKKRSFVKQSWGSFGMRKGCDKSTGQKSSPKCMFKRHSERNCRKKTQKTSPRNQHMPESMHYSWSPLHLKVPWL